MEKMTRGKDHREKTRGKDLRKDKLMKKHKLCLRMFDGEGGAAAAPGTQAPGATVPVAAAQTAENRPASGEEKPDLDTRFEELISGDYREAFERRMENATKERLRKQGAKHAKALGDLQAQMDKKDTVLNLIGSKYGIMDGNLERIQQEIENDTTYWEDAAAKEGMSVDQYMHMKKIERENAQFRKAQDDAARLQKRDQILAKWNGEAAELGKIYPSFNLQAELENPQFANLIGSGVEMRTAYEVLHHDEIMRGAMAHTAKTVAKKQIDAIKNGQSHPVEGAMSSGKAVKTSKDISKMSLTEMKEYAKRAGNGEKITFQED